MTASKRVLLADDDESIRQTVEWALSDEGYEVRTVPDGDKALTLIEEWQPNVILLDMKMPVMDGWAFATAYRQQRASRAPIVVLTAASDAARWAGEISADGVLPKPFDLEDLLTLVDEYTA